MADFRDPASRCAPRCAPAIGCSWSACTRPSRRASRRTGRSSTPPPRSESASIAYLSIVNPSPTAAFHHGRSHDATERMILESGMPYAFLRMNLFLDDLPLWFDPDGVCRGPGGDGRVALISRADTAAVSAGVLVGPGYENEALDLTGEQSHTLGELAALAATCSAGPSLRARNARGLDRRIAAGSRPGTEHRRRLVRGAARGEFDVTSDVVRGSPARRRSRRAHGWRPIPGASSGSERMRAAPAGRADLPPWTFRPS